MGWWGYFLQTLPLTLGGQRRLSSSLTWIEHHWAPGTRQMPLAQHIPHNRPWGRHDSVLILQLRALGLGDLSSHQKVIAAQSCSRLWDSRAWVFTYTWLLFSGQLEQVRRQHLPFDIREVQTYRECWWVHLCQTDDNCQEAIYQWIEKMLQGMAILQFTLYIPSKEWDVKGGYMKSIGGKFRGERKQSWGNIWDWIKSKTERQILLLHWWVQL